MHTTVHDGILVQATDHVARTLGSSQVLHRRIGYQDNELLHSRTIESTEVTVVPSALPAIKKMFSCFERVADVRSTATAKAIRTLQYRNHGKNAELSASVRVYPDRILVTFYK